MLLGNYFNKLIYFLRSENIFYFGKEPFVIGGNENIRADRMLRKRTEYIIYSFSGSEVLLAHINDRTDPARTIDNSRSYIRYHKKAPFAGFVGIS